MALMEAELSALLDTTVIIQLPQAADAYGRVTTLGASTVYRARVQAGTDLIRDEQGRDVTIDGKAILDCIVPIPVQARITFSDGSTSVVRHSTLNNDQNGPYYTVLSFGRA